MKVEYDRDSDRLRVELGAGPGVETRAIHDNRTRIDVDAAGDVCALTIEHARERSEVWSFGDEEQLQQAIAERDRAQAALESSERRLRREYAAFADLARGMRRHGEWSWRLHAITEAAAGALEVERVSIWLFDPDRTRIECADLYELSKGLHSAGAVIAAADYPAYFRALNQERTIAAHNANEDTRTGEFSATYLRPLGIGSMLDAPLRLGVECAGVVCHEHVGPPREWTLDEQNFAGSVADLVSLALEAHVRERTERELWAREEQLQRQSQPGVAIGS